MSALADLYALIPEEGYILGSALPSVFARYEAQRGTHLLQPSERDALEAFARLNAAERVDAGVLVALMGELLGAGKTGEKDAAETAIGGVESGRITRRPISIDPGEMSFLGDTEPPFTPVLPDRPESEVEFGEGGITGYLLSNDEPRPTAKASSTPSTAGKPSTPATGTSQIPRRSPAGEMKPSAPPSSYTPIAGAARRGSDPSTPSQLPSTNSQTRSSSALSNHSPGFITGGITRPRPPRTSISSRRSTSPSSVASFRPSSRREELPGSSIPSFPRPATRPSSATPQDPFRASADVPPGSPDLPALQGADSELSMLDETSFVGHHLGVGDISVDEEIGGRHGSRLDRISTASTSSLAATHDALQALKRENSELLKKKNELARQLQVIGAETEAQMADLQESLDGARAELAGKRREEKESRTREAQLGTQICTLEFEMQHLQQQLSTARESHAASQRMLQDANAEADRLRDALLGKEEDVSGLKVALEGYEDEKRSWQDQLETLQATNATLQTSLQAAQEAARTLERRKAENQDLQQTIKRLTHELDMLRTQQTGAARHGRAPTDGAVGDDKGSVASREGTGRMSLGDELRSHFAPGEADSDEEREKGKGKTVVRTITYRTERVVHHRDRPKTSDDNDDAGSEPETSFVEEIVREYTDAGVATDPASPVMSVTSTAIQTDETHHGALPPYSPRSDGEIARYALAGAHPLLEGEGKALEGYLGLGVEYAEVTMGAGMRCMLIEEKLKGRPEKAIGGAPFVKATPPKRPLEIVYILTALFGIALASYYLGSRHNHHELLRNVFQDYTLPYSHLYVQEFIPRTTAVRTLAGGAKQFAGRTPV